jgi:hypothetical protein
MRNEFMEEWADRVRTEFPPPKYRVELKAFESQLWVVDEQSHHIAELSEEEFAAHTESEIFASIREELLH